MKTIKSLFCLLAVLGFAASCSEKTEMTTYGGRADEAFFSKTGYSYTVSADMEDACSIDVLRATSVGAAQVAVTVEVEDAEVADAFTAPAAVEFADGEIGAPFKVSFDRSKLTVGKEYAVSIKLQSDTQLPYATETELVVLRDYTWKDYKTGVYSSHILPNFFGRAVVWRQTMQVTEENPQLYRLTGLYHNAGTSYSESGYNLNFTWDGGSTVEFPYPADKYGCVLAASGFSHPSYGMVYLYIDPSPEYSGYDAASKTFTFNCAGRVSAGMLIDWNNDTFTLAD
ncbi:MAG: hypothetical protein K2L06_01420 [Alistipes sp.]|nr:hypothetical protein [Alistipes sp.]